MGRIVALMLATTAIARADPSPAPLRYDLELRKDAWLTDELARHDVDSGRVHPAWRTVARGAEAAFRPDPRIVSEADSATLYARQMARFLGTKGILSSPQVEHRVDPSIADAVRFERAIEEEPATWERVEVEARVDERGVVVSTEVVLPSDKVSLNEAALEAVGLALRSTPLPRKKARVRFAVEAGVVVQPPTVTRSIGDPRPRPVPTMKFRFDESSGKVQPPRPWFMRRLLTRVSVLSIQ
jgi:hypothetical protein